MEEYLKHKVNFKDASFFDEYREQYSNELQNLIDKELDTPHQKLIVILLNSLEIYATNVNDALANFHGTEEQLNQNRYAYERLFILLEGVLYDHITEFQLYAQNIEQISKIIGVLGEQSFGLLKFKSLSILVNRLVINGSLHDLTTPQMTVFLKKLQVKFDSKYFNLKKGDVETPDIETICYTWRSCLEIFFEKFTHEEFQRNIDALQEFYE